MDHPLDGVRVKVERAREHLDTLDHELRTFFKPYSNRRIINHRFDGTWHIVSLSPPFDEPFPLRLSIICGDAVHNLRSALDHLVWQLVIVEGGTPGRWTQFPIYDDAIRFNEVVRSPKGRRASPLRGISQNGGVWTLIEGAQPYNCPDPHQHYLSILGKLSNVDKHRTLHTQIPLHSRESLWNAIGWNPAAQLMEHVWSNPELSHEHEAEVLRLRFSQAGPDPQVNVKGKVGIQPTLGDGENLQVTFGGVNQMPVWINALVKQFVKFF